MDRHLPTARPLGANHCVAALEASSVRDGVRVGSLSSFSCFDSFAEAISSATQGLVQVGDGDLEAQLEIVSEELQRMEAAVNVIVGDAPFILAIDYEHAVFDGATLTWTADGPCTPQQSWVASSMPTGWNDVVSSTKGFADCLENILWEHVNWGGDWGYLCDPDCATLPAGVNDQTSSRSWNWGTSVD